MRFPNMELHLNKKDPRGGSSPGIGRVSAFFLKGRAAVAAGDGDPALASGHPELLAAAGALEVAVLLVPVDSAAEPVPANRWCNQLEKFCVFAAPAGGVAGEHPVQGHRQKQQGDPVQGIQPGNHIDQVKNHIGQDQGDIQLVVPVAAVHKALQCVANHKRASLPARNREGKPPGQVAYRKCHYNNDTQSP